MLTEVQPRRGDFASGPGAPTVAMVPPRRVASNASLVRCARGHRRRVGAITGGKRTDSLHYVVGGGVPRVRRTGLAGHPTLGGNRAATTATCSGRSTRPLMSPSRGTPEKWCLVGIDLGIASRHSVRVLEADGRVVCRASCVPTAESLKSGRPDQKVQVKRVPSCGSDPFRSSGANRAAMGQGYLAVGEPLAEPVPVSPPTLF